MAHSVRRPKTLASTDQQEPCRDRTRTSYFGNVKSRLGSKLPPGVSQPPQFAKPPWETQPQSRGKPEPPAWSQHHSQTSGGRPLNHIPHIRNPKLRQYYLQGTSWDLNNAAAKQEHMGGASVDSQGVTRDTVLSVASQFHSAVVSSAMEGPSGRSVFFSSSNRPVSTGDHSSQQLLVPNGGSQASGQRSVQQPEPGSDPNLKQEVKATLDSVDTLTAQPQSPLPEADYDQLLDVEAVPMPDGQLCLLALPPECCQGEGPEAVQYLKLFCRYITDCKGVVSGILLVTSNKIFFDPCKTHPLVREHGCEEYLLSCSVDNLKSVSFVSDISHVHFSTSQQRKKGRKLSQKLKKPAGALPNHKGDSAPSPEAAALSELSALTEEVGEEAGSTDVAETAKEPTGSPLEPSVLGVGVLSSAATFCCGGQEVTNKPGGGDKQRSRAKSETPGPATWSASSPGSVMFVRLRVQPSAGKKKPAGGLQLGASKAAPARDAWLVLSQESSDELYAYLTHCRPDLCILEGGVEQQEEEGVTADRDEEEEEEFVLIEDKGEAEEQQQEVEGEEVCYRWPSSAEDWEMVLMEDGRDKPTLILDRDPEGLGEIVESSSILEASHVRDLSKELPPRTVGRAWQLAYSTSRHGTSLKSLYRKLGAAESPVLVVIKDALDEVFGAFLSHSLKISEAFYGTGETFLFMLHPRFKCFRWTGENSFFIKGDLDSFAIGGGSGHFGLWVDENLYLGRSSPCHTFNNCCLSETDDFRIMELEVWRFA